MILADTSVWCRYLVRSRTPNQQFADLIAERAIICHPWIFGELLLAGISPQVSREIENLDFLAVAPHADVLQFVRQYHPRGIGWVDVHLLVSVIQAGATLWTTDKDLAANARQHGRGMPEE